MSWSQKFKTPIGSHDLLISSLRHYARSAVNLLNVSFSYSGAQGATAKFIEIICFAKFATFHVYLLIQIYFESK